VSVKPTELVKSRKLGAAKVMEAGYAVAQYVETLRYKPEVGGSIPDGITGIFLLLNFSGLIMALWSTQSLRAVFTRCIS
jgi:hypothetical protein